MANFLFTLLPLFATFSIALSGRIADRCHC